MAHLVLGVRYGDAPITSALYTVAFLRQMAVPHIAEVLYRDGRGTILRDTRQRNDDTMTFFGEFLRLGHSSYECRAMIERLGRIHSGFPIENAQSLYTLSSLVFEGERIPEGLGVELLTPVERIALRRFWMGVGRAMGLADVPDTHAEFRAWCTAYEDANYAYSDAGHAVAMSMIDDWALRWFPASLLRHGRTALLALCDDRLLDTLRIAPPPRHVRRLAGVVLRAYRTGRRLLPDPAERSWSDHFGRAYGGRPTPDALGVHPAV